jgi:cytochrome c oxidase cbb3-type subunit 3
MFKKIFDKLQDAVPVEREHEILIDEEHDGIQELDNRLPPWWTWFFVICVVFGYAYIFHYHTFGTGELSAAEFESEMKIADAQVAAVREKLYAGINETTVKALSDEKALANGKKVYLEKCSSCHGQAGEGGVGPNLTDQNWLHGCAIGDVFKTISDGVPVKGMISWKAQLNPMQIQEVASFVLTFKGTNPANGKAPEGEVCGSAAPIGQAN